MAGCVILPFLLLLNVLAVQAQYFNLHIDFMGYNFDEVGFAVEQMENGNYLVFHGARPETGDNLGLGRTIVSPDGEVLEQMAHFSENSVLYTGYSNTSFKLANGGFVSSGSRSSSEIASLVSLCHYGTDGGLDCIRFYGDTVNQSVGRAAVQHVNKNFASVGWKQVDGPDLDMGFLLITDSIGEMLALNEYGGRLADHLYSIYPTFDGGYILGGFTWTFGTVGKWDHYIVKTDSVGNQEWMEVMGV